ncbi:NUDIX domain-containing protein [Fulvivirgaceae bacterium BMA12]|uniref:NUDIX domain-containing protein n=1 Tax=Agaribacillus aureus TaxID=3051825 RepID=A0ABT8L367_9BACT|nr:NUDIX domain-containing protein [Fulvivirgaceae bacterium BMA12]
MKIFVNNIPVNIIAKTDLKEWDVYHTIKKGDNKMISQLDLMGDILFVDLAETELKVFFLLMQDKKFKKATSITFAVNDYQSAKKLVKDQFTIVKAAGGLVLKKDQYLLIYRLKKWDLPKGKSEDGEKMKVTAIREVEEECSIKVDLRSKIGVTWHTYMQNDKRILKKTNWYLMDCVDDKDMKPQEKESIEKVAWFDKTELPSLLKNSYPSIVEVFKKFNKKFDHKIKLF